MDDKNTIRKTVSSHQKDNVKHDENVTTCSHTRDTAGGGRGAFSNSYGNEPISIKQYTF